MDVKRQETGWEPPEPDLPPLEPEQERVVADARTLLAGFGRTSNAEADMSAYLSALLDSDWMIEEPEFEAIYLSPVHLTGRYAEAATAAGFDPDSFRALEEDERSEKHLDFLTRAISEMLDEGTRKEILDALDALRERLLEEGEREQAARTGLVLDFLEQKDNVRAWATVGVIIALGQRSLAAGFALTGATRGTDDAFTEDGTELIPEVQAVLEQYPGLVQFLAVDRDRVWEDGLQSLFLGDLWLDLFREDELQPRIAAWKRAVELDEAGEEEERDAQIEEISRYATGLLQTGRIRQILDRLMAVLDSGTLGTDHEAFVGMVVSALIDEETVVEGVRALLAAFFGELRQRVEEVEDGE